MSCNQSTRRRFGGAERNSGLGLEGENNPAQKVDQKV